MGILYKRERFRHSHNQGLGVSDIYYKTIKGKFHMTSDSEQKSPTHSNIRMAFAGMSHGHINWILRNWQRKDIDIVGFWEPDRGLAERYAAQYNVPLQQIYSDLDAMLDALQPEAVCAFGRSTIICVWSKPVCRN